MIGKLLKLAGWIGDAREWLMLLALAAIAAGFYVDARRVRADRDAWASWGGTVCAFAGSTTAAATVTVQTDKGPRKVEKARGQRCSEAVQDLAAFKAGSQAATAGLLADAAKQQETKAAVDRAAAADDGAARRAAAAHMEEIDAQIRDDDRVDGNWFAGLNGLGGLR